MNDYIVYMHTCPNGKRYVGITKSLENRWRNGEGYKTQLFYRAIKKYGWENINHEILFENLSLQSANEKEIELIIRYNTNNPAYGYNVTSVGDGVAGLSGEKSPTYGRKLSDEQKQVLRDAHIGKKASEETKHKMSEYHKGKKHSLGYKHSPETLIKRSLVQIGENNSFYGKNHNDDSKAKMSEYAKTKTLSKNSNARKTSVMHNGNILEFDTRKECMQFLSVSHSEFYRQLKSGKLIIIKGQNINE